MTDLVRCYPYPTNTPWGEPQHCDEIYPGMFQVDTASHGGILVRIEQAPALTAAAQEVGFREGPYLCFEEDCDAPVVLRELLDKPGWEVPKSYTNTREKFEAAIDRSLEAWQKDYLAARTANRAAMAQTPEQRGLPSSCFSILPSSNDIIFIERGGKGFTKLDRLSDDIDAVRAFVDKGNKALGVTRAQEEAMVAGSMFGWDVPGADPKNYDRSGVPVKPKNRTGIER